MRRELKEAWGLALEGRVEREARTLVLAVGTLSNLGQRSLTWLLQEDNFGGGGSEYKYHCPACCPPEVGMACPFHPAA